VTTDHEAIKQNLGILLIEVPPMNDEDLPSHESPPAIQAARNVTMSNGTVALQVVIDCFWHEMPGPEWQVSEPSRRGALTARI
jgi:hypothetical protein